MTDCSALCAALAVAMAQGEVLLLTASLVVALVGWARWGYRIGRVVQLRRQTAPRRLVAWTPIACALLLFLLLKRFAAADVRDDGRYLTQYELLGLAWLVGWERIVRWLGLAAREDVAEQQNPAAAIAIAGALLGGTLTFAGANVGDGPGFEVVLFTALLATAAHAAVAALHAAIGGMHELITVERDLAAGLRTAGFHLAAGLLAGRAAAGDWISTADATHDLVAHGWPLLPLGIAAALIDRISRPTPDRPAPSPLLHGVVPAGLYLALAFAWLVELGAP